MNIIYKNEQIQELTEAIMESNDLLHYIVKKQNGLLFVTDLEDSKECILKGWEAIGVITKPNSCNNEEYIKKQIKQLIL